MLHVPVKCEELWRYSAVVLQQSHSLGNHFLQKVMCFINRCVNLKKLRGGYSRINFVPQAIRWFLDIYTALFVHCLGFEEDGLPGLGSGQMDLVNIQGQEYIALGVALLGQKHTFLIKAAIVANEIRVL